MSATTEGAAYITVNKYDRSSACSQQLFERLKKYTFPLRVVFVNVEHINKSAFKSLTEMDQKRITDVTIFKNPRLFNVSPRESKVGN